MKSVVVSAGDRYGRLSVVEEISPGVSPTNKRRYRRVTCRCDCGNIITTRLETLRRGDSKSCGCLQKDKARRSGLKNATHNASQSPAYVSWAQMKQRCCNPNSAQYERYGGRGISVCGSWRNSFEAFLRDMGPRPKGCSIDRIDNDGNYEPGNCRWASDTTQARNCSTNVRLSFRGKTMCISEWADEIGMPRKTLEKRLNHHGYTVEEALTMPLRARRAKAV